jgi:GntR family transcriptional regulator
VRISDLYHALYIGVKNNIDRLNFGGERVILTYENQSHADARTSVKKNAASTGPEQHKKRCPAKASERAYLQVVESLKNRIASGEYRPDQKIPSEKELGLEFGLSLLTIRQAVGVLAGQGVLKKVPSKGTYVQKLNWRTASFHLVGLADHLTEDKDAKVKILKAGMEKVTEDLASFLGVAPETSVVRVERLLISEEQPIIFQESFLPCDPRRPIMESELEATYMAGLFTGLGDTGLIQKASMDISLGELSDRQAKLLGRPLKDKTFVLEYTFFDQSGQYISRGRFWVIPEVMRLSGRVGLWPGEGGS